MTTATAFDLADVELLLERYEAAAGEDEPRRPPWTWAALDRAERAALARMVDVFVSTYNHVHAVKDNELVPPCWRRHPALAAELAVQVWLWYFAHMDPKASPAVAGDYYGRHLPGFRSRVDRLLGVSPGECRQGEHPDTWRKEAEQLLAKYDGLPSDPDQNEQDVDLLGALHFGFPHLNNEGQD